MDEFKAKIFNIERARDVDGPGIRTLVGFCSCPLKCTYCLNKQALSSGEGKWYSPESLLKEVQMDDTYFQSTGGGVTFGGGEPALQSEFIVRFREICPPEWTLAIETSLNVPQEHIEAIIGAMMLDAGSVYTAMESLKEKSLSEKQNKFAFLSICT